MLVWAKYEIGLVHVSSWGILCFASWLSRRSSDQGLVFLVSKLITMLPFEPRRRGIHRDGFRNSLMGAPIYTEKL